jgi:hypothetical protein
MTAARILLLAVLTSGCRDLDEVACAQLRSEAFDAVNTSHSCRDDTDCYLSAWPGCPKPINRQARARVTDLHARFEKGGCSEEPASCPTPAEAYCDRQFCILKYRRTSP